MAQASYLALAAGVLTALVAGIAIAQEIVLSISSFPVAMLAGVLVGAVVGGLLLVFTAGRSTPDLHRHLATSSTLFGVIALAIFVGASSADVANATSMIAGVAVGAVVALGVLFWLRENSSRQVNAVTMR